MIKKLFNRLLGKGRAQAQRFGQRQEHAADVHGIDRNAVDERAVAVVRTLKKAGFEAYIVGGAVRDLLLGLKPKDFDVATNATPEQVKSLFRRAFIIGRRFRIVHVVHGRGREHEVIEVSTFRAFLDANRSEAVQGDERSQKALAGVAHAVDANGRVLRDNVWGPQEEDAARRDFTVNAMYYDPEREVVVDYHQGLKDARAQVLRMIGDPAARYREDPVRVIRAARFAAKLSARGFKLEAHTARPLKAALPLLGDVPPSRLFDEMLKLLQTGHALASVAVLRELGLQGIDPLLDLVLARAEQPMLAQALSDTDQRVARGLAVAPSFLLACVLWSDVLAAWTRERAQQAAHPALLAAIDQVFDARVGDVSGRGKLGADMREIWLMQPRFERRMGATPFSLIEQPRYRAGFDFLSLRARSGEVDEVLVNWWETFVDADDDLRRDMLEEVRLQARARPSGGRRGRKAAPDAPTSPEDGATQPPEQAPAAQAQADDPAPRKRRRRRKPRHDGDAPTSGGASDAPQA